MGRVVSQALQLPNLDAGACLGGEGPLRGGVAPVQLRLERPAGRASGMSVVAPTDRPVTVDGRDEQDRCRDELLRPAGRHRRGGSHRQDGHNDRQQREANPGEPRRPPMAAARERGQRGGHARPFLVGICAHGPIRSRRGHRAAAGPGAVAVCRCQVRSGCSGRCQRVPAARRGSHRGPRSARPRRSRAGNAPL